MIFLYGSDWEIHSPRATLPTFAEWQNISLPSRVMQSISSPEAHSSFQQQKRWQKWNFCWRHVAAGRTFLRSAVAIMPPAWKCLVGTAGGLFFPLAVVVPTQSWGGWLLQGISKNQQSPTRFQLWKRLTTMQRGWWQCKEVDDNAKRSMTMKRGSQQCKEVDKDDKRSPQCREVTNDAKRLLTMQRGWWQWKVVADDAKRSPTMQRGCQWHKEVAYDAKRSPTMQRGRQRCKEVDDNAKRLMMTKRGCQQCKVVADDAKRLLTMQRGHQQCKEVVNDAKRSPTMQRGWWQHEEVEDDDEVVDHDDE